MVIGKILALNCKPVVKKKLLAQYVLYLGANVADAAVAAFRFVTVLLMMIGILFFVILVAVAVFSRNNNALDAVVNTANLFIYGTMAR